MLGLVIFSPKVCLSLSLGGSCRDGWESVAGVSWAALSSLLSRPQIQESEAGPGLKLSQGAQWTGSSPLGCSRSIQEPSEPRQPRQCEELLPTHHGHQAGYVP